MPYVVAALGPMTKVILLGLAELAVISLAWHDGDVYWGAPLHFLGAFCFLHGSQWLCGCVVFVQWRLATATRRGGGDDEEVGGRGGGGAGAGAGAGEGGGAEGSSSPEALLARAQIDEATLFAPGKMTRWKIQRGLFAAMLFITYVSDIGLWIIGRALSAAMPPDDDDDDGGGGGGGGDADDAADDDEEEAAGPIHPVQRFHDHYWGAINQWVLVVLIWLFFVTVAQHMAAWKGIESDGELEAAVMAAVQRAAVDATAPLNKEKDGEERRRRGGGDGACDEGAVVELARAWESGESMGESESPL